MTPEKAGTETFEQNVHGTGETTVDAFHKGAFEVLQPKQGGHRSGLDALLLAAAVPQNAEGILADFGSGAGVAGFAAVNLNRQLRLLSIEKNPQMASLAHKSLQLQTNSFLKERCNIIEADVTAKGTERIKLGMAPDSVHHAVMNPPYNASNLRSSPDVLKMEAYMMGDGGIDAWFRTAASMIKPGGTLSLIYRTENLGELLACTQGRFGELKILPVHSRKGDASKRLIVRGIRGSRGPLSVLPGFTVHKEDGGFTIEAEEIFAGEAFLSFG